MRIPSNRAIRETAVTVVHASHIIIIIGCYIELAKGYAVHL